MMSATGERTKQLKNRLDEHFSIPGFTRQGLMPYE